MRKSIKTTLCACAGLLPCMLSASTILGTYAFDDVISASNTADNTTLSNFAIGPGVAGTFPDYSGLAVSGKSNLFHNAGFNSTNQAGAVDTDRYIGFSSEVDEGYFVDYASISFYSLRRTGGDDDVTSGLGAPSDYALFVSTDGFSASVATGNIEGNLSNTFSLNTIDLSEIAMLQTLTDPVEFRLYLWAGEGLATPSERQLRIDDFSASGSVTVIPEPNAIAFAGVTALLFMLCRRSRNRTRESRRLTGQ